VEGQRAWSEGINRRTTATIDGSLSIGQEASNGPGPEVVVHQTFWGLAARLAVTIVAIVSGALLASPTAAASAAGAPSWRVAGQPPGAFTAAAVTCVVGMPVCVAVGSKDRVNAAEYSRNGGANWGIGAIPRANGGQFISSASVSCVDPGTGHVDCAVWAELGQRSQKSTQTTLAHYYSTTGGATWSAVAGISIPVGYARNSTATVTCYALAGDADCIVLLGDGGGGDGVLRSTNGGESWTWISPNQAGTGIFPSGLACALNEKQLDCAAVGYLLSDGVDVPDAYFSTDGGNTWYESALTSSRNACRPVRGGRCVPEVLDVEGQLQAVSCVTVSTEVDCAATGSVMTGGNCASTALNSCYKITSIAVYSKDGGDSWSYGKVPPAIVTNSIDGGSSPDTLSCVSGGTRTYCAEAATYVPPDARADSLGSLVGATLFSGNGGATWSQSEDLGRSQGPITCITASPTPACWLVGNVFAAGYTAQGRNRTGVADFSSNGGATWVLSTVNKGLPFVAGPACTSASECIAATATAMVTTSYPARASS